MDEQTKKTGKTNLLFNLKLADFAKFFEAVGPEA